MSMSLSDLIIDCQEVFFKGHLQNALHKWQGLCQHISWQEMCWHKTDKYV